jgi:very-short-patch-repair endonuclease
MPKRLLLLATALNLIVGINMRGAHPWKTERAKSLRSTETSAEAKLWSHLRNRHLGGFKFVRQAPIADYFADFLCRNENLVVEVDGGTHGEPNEIAADLVRSAAIERLGFRIYRVSNTDIFENIDGVLDDLLAYLERRKE